MNAAIHAQAENARLMRQFGDDLRTMPALWSRYQANLIRIQSAQDRAAAKRRYEVAS